MSWDYAESNPFAESSGDYYEQISRVVNVLSIGVPQIKTLGGMTLQEDATQTRIGTSLMISTDPPYYDNISYAGLSDFFFVWLRRSLKDIYPGIFSTLLVPKTQELVADQYRFNGDKAQAERFFEQGLGMAFARMRDTQHVHYPLTVYYAFKQAESENNENDVVHKRNSEINIESLKSSVASTGWETMLEGLIRAGFAINGTWPMRTERGARSISIGTNALASSIILVCRPRFENVKAITRLEFIRALRRELPAPLRALQHANIAPVDLAQAAIGPGMAIYSRYRAVLEADGSPMRVRTALQLINQALDEVLAEQEGEYDNDTRWAIAWFEQSAFEEGQYGVAETLSKAKNTSVQGMVDAGVASARAGKVRLLRRDELPPDWNPTADKRVTAWEATQHLVRALDKHGESGAAAVLAALPGGIADVARDLAYRLYTTCERKKWAQEALAYNSLVVAWPEIARLAAELGRGGPVQGQMAF
jgi:putative DNA methylase